MRVAMSLASLLIAATTVRVGSAADRIEVCASAAEESQSLRAQGHLTAARKKLVVCADPACPGVVKTHCSTWLAEVDKATPSVALRARDVRGQDVGGARVLVDGTEIASSITGLPVPVDPGPHTLRVVTISGAIAEQPVVIAEGEKNRAVVLTFKERLFPDGSSDGAEALPRPIAPPPRVDSTPSRITPPFVITAGLGVVALGVFAGFDIAGHHDYASLRDNCGPSGDTCPTNPADTISSGRTKYAVAGVALGVAGAALGVATVILIAFPKSRTRTSEALKSLGVVRF